MKLLSFGEIIFDIQNGASCLGGAPLNFCAHAVRCGAEGYMISAVGNDDLGKSALSSIEGYGISSDYIGISDELETGRCIVSLSNRGIPSYDIVKNVAYDEIPLPDISERFDLLYFGTLALRSDKNKVTLTKLLSMNIADEVFVDINIRPPFCSAESIIFALNNATILKISDEEMSYVCDVLTCENDAEQLSVYISESFKNIKLLIITQGEKGSAVYDIKNNKYYRCDAVKTKVVSTVGAGDSFSACFATSYLSKEDIPESLKKASELSAYVVAHQGAIP